VLLQEAGADPEGRRREILPPQRGGGASPRRPLHRRCGGGRWRPQQRAPRAVVTCVGLRRGGGQLAAGPSLYCFFLFLFVCRASQHRHTTEGVGRCLPGMLDTVWKGPPFVFFVVRRPWRTTKILNRAFRGRHTTNRLYRAKHCRVPFVVRLG
jgi:hypothetical protein